MHIDLPVVLTKLGDFEEAEEFAWDLSGGARRNSRIASFWAKVVGVAGLPGPLPQAHGLTDVCSNAVRVSTRVRSVIIRVCVVAGAVINDGTIGGGRGRLRRARLRSAGCLGRRAGRDWPTD